MIGGDAVEVGQHQRIGEEDRVIEERLRRHQAQAHECAPALDAKQRVSDLRQRRGAARAQPDHRRRFVRDVVAAGAELGLDAIEHRRCLLDTAMGHQPARRFRQPQAHEEDDEAEHGPDQKRQAPSQIRRQQVGIEHHQRSRRAERGADPEAAVDDEIGPAAVARRHQLLNGRIDGGVLAADAGAGEEAKQREARQIPRQRGRRSGE